MLETYGGHSCMSSVLIQPIYSPRTSDGGRSRVMMVEDGGCKSCVMWMVPDRLRDVWIDHRSSMANATSRSVDRSVESG